MSQRSEHRIGERAFIPGPVVAPAVDEERGCDEHTAFARALDVGVDPVARTFFGHTQLLRVKLLQAQIRCHRFEILLGQGF